MSDQADLDANARDDDDAVDDGDPVDDVNAADDAEGVDVDDDADPNRVPAATATAVLDYVVRQLVADPDAVTIELDETGRRPALNVRVGQGDMGRVIGKRGHVAQAIRTVTRAAASRDGLELDIEFLD